MLNAGLSAYKCRKPVPKIFPLSWSLRFMIHTTKQKDWSLELLII